LLGIAARYLNTCVAVQLASLQGSLPCLTRQCLDHGRSHACSIWPEQFLQLGKYDTATSLHHFDCRRYGWLLLLYVCRRKHLLTHTHHTMMMAIFSAYIVYVLAKGLKLDRKLKSVMAINTTYRNSLQTMKHGIQKLVIHRLSETFMMTFETSPTEETSAELRVLAAEGGLSK